MHWHDTKPFYDGQLLLSGSTVSTAIHKIESEQQKCIYKFDNSLHTIPLENQRKVIWKEFEFDPNIKSNLENFISTVSLTKPKPIISIKIKGQVRRDYLLPSFSEIEEKYRNRAIVNINRDLQVEGFQEQIELLRMLREQKLSPEEHGLKILQENLKQVNCGIRVDEIFEYLIEGNNDLIFSLLMGEQKTLK